MSSKKYREYVRSKFFSHNKSVKLDSKLLKYAYNIFKLTLDYDMSELKIGF